MIEDSVKHRIQGLEQLGSGWDEDLHDAVFESIHYCSPKQTCEVVLQSWNDEEDGNHRKIHIRILFDGIRRFQINDDVRGGFTNCIDIKQCRDNGCEDCLEFTAEEIDIIIRAKNITILSVDKLESI